MGRRKKEEDKPITDADYLNALYSIRTIADEQYTSTVGKARRGWNRVLTILNEVKIEGKLIGED